MQDTITDTRRCKRCNKAQLLFRELDEDVWIDVDNDDEYIAPE